MCHPLFLACGHVGLRHVGLRCAKRKGESFGKLHKCSSHRKFVSGDLGTWVPRVSVNGQPVPFPAPCRIMIQGVIG